MIGVLPGAHRALGHQHPLPNGGVWARGGGPCPGVPGALEIILALMEAGRSGEAKGGGGKGAGVL